ncbi:MAG: hypothetical protein AAGN46_10755 [Acidobacteriota bacterium]
MQIPMLKISSHRSTLSTLSGRRAAGALGVALLVALLTAACTGEGKHADTPAPLEAEDVVGLPSPSIEDDVQAPPPAARLSGVLPTDFPEDLPVFVPASLIAFGDSASGRDATLLTNRGLAEVRSGLGAQLDAAGWQRRAVGDGFELTKGARRASIRLESDGSATTILYQY